MNFAFSSRSFLPFLISLLVTICLSDAFHISNDACYYPSQGLKNEYLKPTYECELRRGKDHLVTLSAKKKRRRRRRKESDTSPEDQSEKSLSESILLPVGDELPDFDLGGEVEEASQRVRISSNPDEITPAMMADGNAAARSLDELIMDRSLENKFKFDEPEDPNIPDFIQLGKESSSPLPSLNDGTSMVLGGGGIGKKKQRQAERIANAIRVKEEEKQVGSNILSKIPSFLNEKGEVSAVKVLEQGAWLGIYSLIGWEIYINSPFFDRAGPMAPIVYEILM